MSKSINDSFIVELTSPSSVDPTIVGSKAASVANLVSQGTTVPSGFAVSASAFSEFVAPVQDELATLQNSVDIDEIASIFQAEKSIRRLLEIQPLPGGLEAEIVGRVKSSPEGLAVRSSATAEDLEGASFAGMYDTFLDATDAKSVLNRIRDVWISYYTGRAISYRIRQNIPHENGAMAALVMDLINADAGGVLFTRDPRDGTNQILVNVALGLGEGVVSGETKADSFTLDSNTLAITNRNVIDKDFMLVRGTAGSTDRVPVPSAQRSAPALTDDQITAVAEAAQKIKAESGDDRDIEFAVAGDTIHILQSRPVTTGEAKSTDFPVEWDSPEQEKLHWMASGRFPVRPLSIDYLFMAGKAQKRSVDITGQYMGRGDLKKLVNGYMYAAESPRDPEELKKRLLNHHLQGRRYIEQRTTYYCQEVEPVLLKNLEMLERVRPADDEPIPDHIANLRIAMQTTADHMNDLHWRCWAGFPRDGGRTKEFAKVTGMTELETSVFTLGIDHMTARLTKRLIGLAGIVKSDPWLSEIFESRDYESLFARGNGKREAVKQFRARFRSMMNIWGRRNGLGYGTAWQDTDPSWNMKPEIPLDSIGSYARQDLEAAGRSHNDLKSRRESAIQTARKRIGRDTKRRKRFEFLLFASTINIQMMENHNYLIEQRSNGEYRESIFRTGSALVREGWIDEPDDVYFLRLGELEDAASANDYTGLRLLIAATKAEREKNMLFERPEFIGAPKPKDEKKDEEEPLRGISEDGLQIHGEPSSSGSFTGTARVIINRTSTPPNVTNGEILVVENTGPDWVPVFPLIGGIVLDGGDNFQHASLIAREYGIPCVIQTKDSTSKIGDGQLITVDGTAGTVTLYPTV